MKNAKEIFCDHDHDKHNHVRNDSHSPTAIVDFLALIFSICTVADPLYY